VYGTGPEGEEDWMGFSSFEVLVLKVASWSSGLRAI
jgi:hypothetical protein